VNCPSEETWLLAELGDVTVNTRDAMLTHEQDCAACRALRVRLRQLLEDLAVPPPFQVADEFVAKVMAGCAADGERSRAARGQAWRRTLPWTGGLLAIAAAFALAWLPAKNDGVDGQLRARGGNQALPLQVGALSADVFLARGKTLQRLGDATLGNGDRLAVRVVNQTSEARFFMAFAIDAAGDVHWLFPAYSNAAENPEASELLAYQAARVLPETVELLGTAEGALRVVSLLSDRRMNVKEVEGRLLSQPKTPLTRMFPESTLREWNCMWRRR
jgi:hypothetical protein